VARRRYKSKSVFGQSSSSGVGTKLIRVLLILIGLALVGGVVVLGLWDIEPPTRTVEKPIPSERFLR
jgi:hypothetical protein